MSDGTKVSGKNYPTPAIIDGRVCLVLQVPDALEYRAAMYGQIEWLADWRCWKHDETAYADPPQVNRDIAAMFAEMVATATWEECVDFCERMAQCLIDQNVALINALAGALTTNQTLLQAISDANAENGGATPGQPISPSQAIQDLLPENVRTGDDCDLNALWGACLYLVQSGNRAITDVYEQIEVASNTIEAMAIASETIPAAGNYVSAAAQFADQLLENISEGYAGAYTEEYEEQLACELFCLARINCELDLEQVLNAVGARLDFTEVLPDFGVLMTTVGAGTWSGDSIADVSFWTFFAALRFGQVYGDTVGIRPLTVLMSLGADQLASDNWMVLCDCPDVKCRLWDAAHELETTWGPGGGGANQAVWDVDGWARNNAAAPARVTIVQDDMVANRDVTQVVVELSAIVNNGDTNTVTLYGYEAGGFIAVQPADVSTTITFNVSVSEHRFVIDVVSDGSISGAPVNAKIMSVKIIYEGDDITTGVDCL